MSTFDKHQVDDQYERDGVVYSEVLVKPETLDKFDNAKLDDFLLIATYPKAGTTWTQELTWLMLHDGDFQRASQETVYDRVPFVETSDYMDHLQDIDNPKLIKSHMQAKFFAKHIVKGLKVILVIRNPKDTLVSYFHFYKAVRAYHFPGNWDDFFEQFKHKNIPFGDYFDFYTSWANPSFGENVLLVKYEDLQADGVKELDRIGKFTGKNHPKELLEKIARYCTFNNMKDNKMSNYTTWPELMDQTISPFMRKGKVGDWKNYFSDEQSAYVDRLCEDKFKDFDIQFDD